MLTPGPGVLRPAELTSTESADLLAQLYVADHGQVDDAPSTQQRTADYLSCHEEARDSAWTAWSAELNPADWDAAEDWLDVEFGEPCPEGSGCKASARGRVSQSGHVELTGPPDSVDADPTRCCRGRHGTGSVQTAMRFYSPDPKVGENHDFATVLPGVINSCAFTFKYIPYNSGIARVKVSSFLMYDTVVGGRTVEKATPQKPYGAASYDSGRASHVVVDNFGYNDPQRPGYGSVTVAYRYPANLNIRYKAVGFVFDTLFFDGSGRKVTKIVPIDGS